MVFGRVLDETGHFGVLSSLDRSSLDVAAEEEDFLLFFLDFEIPFDVDGIGDFSLRKRKEKIAGK